MLKLLLNLLHVINIYYFCIQLTIFVQFVWVQLFMVNPWHQLQLIIFILISLSQFFIKILSVLFILITFIKVFLITFIEVFLISLFLPFYFQFNLDFQQQQKLLLHSISFLLRQYVNYFVIFIQFIILLRFIFIFVLEELILLIQLFVMHNHYSFF